MDEISAPDGEYPAGSSVLMQFVVLGLDLGKKKKKSNSAFPVCAWPRLNSLKSRSLGVNQTSHQAFGFWVLFGPITDPNMTQYS